MAEKRENIKNNNNYENVGMILKPFFLYFVVYFITLVFLTYLVNLIVRKAGGELEALFMEQQMTVNAILGGLSMLAGILPLISDFRRELHGNNVCNCKAKNKKAKNGKANEIGESGENGENNSNCHGIKEPLCKFLLTITLAFASSITINFLFIKLHLTESSESYSQVAEHQYGVFFPIGLFLYGVVSPLAEEIVFRGFVYNRMKKVFPVIRSLIFSALLFGLYHGNVVQALYGFLMGMLIAYTYEKCGGFLYAFLFHAVANTAVYIITGNQVLYELLITLPGGMVCGGVLVVLLFLLKQYL